MIGRLLAIVVLLLFNGYFVAAEFALVRSRRTRLDAMARGGDAKARLALRATATLPRLLSASQLGITLASLALGWVAESTLGDSLAAWFGTLPFVIESSLRVSIGAIVALFLLNPGKGPQPAVLNIQRVVDLAQDGKIANGAISTAGNGGNDTYRIDDRDTMSPAGIVSGVPRSG